MSTLTFHIVDVFAEKKYAGNQLAVIRGGQALSDAEMQQIAREMHFSETTFLLSETPSNGGYDVRIFTPGAEVPFAGHPTLGTAHIIRTEIAGVDSDRIVLNLKVGQIPVMHSSGSDGGLYWMRQIEPAFGRILLRESLAPVLGLAASDIDERFPIEEVSTGLPAIIVPLKSLAALQRARIATDKYFTLIEGAWARTILVFSPESHQPGNHASVRMFADCFGIPEDPATGSGNGCLAGYLVRHRYWGNDRIDIRVEQGYEIQRPSLLYLRAESAEGHIHISVGGKAVTIARGEFC
jgi:trans-2,3-dihydro-3-hydroxyanthranilate isomerase